MGCEGDYTMPCTTILVGKKASYDGSTLMARNDDSQAGELNIKKCVVIKPEEQMKQYASVLSAFKMDLPEDPMRYTCVPNVKKDRGIWAGAGINEVNVAMSATETITSNPRVLGADPLCNDGIGEEDMVVLVLPYIHSAREGVLRLASILEKYGTYEMNGIGFQDVDEIWWLETIVGHHWIAKRVPDDRYVIMANQQGIDSFDFSDAFGNKENHMCHPDMLNFIKDNFLNSTGSSFENFNVREAFGSKSDFDKVYNTPRVWYSQRYLNPNSYIDEPESFTLPWSLTPESLISIEDVKYVLSSHYQHTDVDPYNNGSNKYRSVGINRNTFVVCTQLRPYCQKDRMAVEWLAFACNAFNTFIPFYANVTSLPSYIQDTPEIVDSNSLFWASRMIGALTDSHYASCHPYVEQYQLKVQSQMHTFLSQFDKDSMHDLKDKNQIISDYMQKETTLLLNELLFIDCNEMKNAFSRSDG